MDTRSPGDRDGPRVPRPRPHRPDQAADHTIPTAHRTSQLRHWRLDYRPLSRQSAVDAWDWLEAHGLNSELTFAVLSGEAP